MVRWEAAQLQLLGGRSRGRTQGGLCRWWPSARQGGGDAWALHAACAHVLRGLPVWRLLLWPALAPSPPLPPLPLLLLLPLSAAASSQIHWAPHAAQQRAKIRVIVAVAAPSLHH